MFRRLAVAPDRLDDLDRAEALIRAHFGLVPHDIVLVSEEPGTQPGLPARLTVLRFWKDDLRYRLKLFKPVAAVTRDDLPVAWLLPALIDDGDPDCC